MKRVTQFGKMVLPSRQRSEPSCGTLAAVLSNDGISGRSGQDGGHCVRLAMPIARHPDCSPFATLATCHALLFTLEGSGGSLPVEVIVWRDKPSLIKPVDDERLRDLRSGDDVLCGERLTKVLRVVIYR